MPSLICDSEECGKDVSDTDNYKTGIFSRCLSHTKSIASCSCWPVLLCHECNGSQSVGFGLFYCF